jgi:hypothetical protein
VWDVVDWKEKWVYIRDSIAENYPFIRLFRSLSQDECGNSDMPGSRDADAIFLPSLKVKFYCVSGANICCKSTVIT